MCFLVLTTLLLTLPVTIKVPAHDGFLGHNPTLLQLSLSGIKDVTT